VENRHICEPGLTKTISYRSHALTSYGQRGAALGETPLPSAPRSIFEYISKKDQERIKNIAGNRFAPPSTSDDPSPGPSLPTSPMITHTEPHVAQAALHGFQPFMTDPPKQARYTAYLRAHANPGSGAIPPTQKSGQSPEEFAKEISDYAKSAALFRPVSGAMAGRFTSAAVLDLGPKIIEGLHTPAAQPEEGADSMDAEEKPKEEVKEEAPKVHAARLGMYGVMTREVCMWQPARLLCKRFGVKDPDLEVPVDTSGPSAQAAAPEFTDTAPADEFADASAGMTQVESGASGNSKRDVANIGLGEDDGQGNDVLTYERPGMDIFKAIFASDDEESDEEKDHMDDVNEVDEPPAVSAPAGPSKPGLDVKPLPANGIVEDVDLATFKPTFIPRGSKQKDAEKKDKKNKKQKSSKGGALVSFDVDEDGGESLSLTAAHQKHRDRGSERPRKKRRKDREGNGGEDMWVEKPPPDIVKALPINLSPDEPEGGQVSGQESGPPRARKRAIDFM
jgi:G patch domain-containing protein 1